MTEHNTTAVEETPSAAPQEPAPKPRKPKAKAQAGGETETPSVEYVDTLNATDSKKPADVAIIKLFRNADFPPGGQPFGVNGRFFNLQAEVWYRVPRWLLSTIDNCVVDQPVTDDNNRFIGTSQQPRFPYTEHRG